MFNIQTTDYQWLKYFFIKKYEYDSSQHSSLRSFLKEKTRLISGQTGKRNRMSDKNNISSYFCVSKGCICRYFV